MSKPREFWIEFHGDPSDDKKPYERFVSGAPVKSKFPDAEIIHVREVMPGETDRSKVSVHGTDGCSNCETGRITIYAGSRYCLECQAKCEKPEGNADE